MKRSARWLPLCMVLGIFTDHPASGAVQIRGDPTPDYVTIQNAINNARPFDHIMVSTGVYPEVITIGDFDEGLVIEGKFRHDFSGKAASGETVIRLPVVMPHGRIVHIFNSQDIQLIDLTVTLGRPPLTGEGMDGGGVYIEETSEVEIVRCRIVDNRASGYGGGIYVQDSSLHVVESDVVENQALNATAGVWQPAGRGGGIAVQNGALILDGVSRVRANNAAQHGGGIAAQVGSRVEVLGAAWINGNQAQTDGGGIWVDGVSTCVVRGIDIRIGFNDPGEGPNRAVDGNGGGIYARNSVLLVDGAAVAHNRANSDGGGIYLTNSIGVVSNAWIGWPANFIHTNRAARGGGISTAHSALSLASNVIVHGNQASIGGGLHLLYSTGTLDRARIRHNRATSHGGGLQVTSGRIEARHSHIHDNQAVNAGGGGRLHTSLAFFEGGSISNNTAGSSGGGLYAFTRPLMMTNVLVVRNHADGDGGGLALSGMTLATDPPSSFDRVELDRNTANRHGGAVWVTNAFVRMDGVYISDNRADAGGVGIGNGGAICAEGGYGVRITSGTAPTWIYRNHAQDGGGIFAKGGATVTVEKTSAVYNFWISNNQATNDGGGLHVRDGVLTVTGAVVMTANTAGRDGGGMFLLSSAAHLTDGVNIGGINGNQAGRYGGGLATALSTSRLHGVTFRHNTSRDFGGGADFDLSFVEGEWIDFIDNRSLERSGGGLSGTECIGAFSDISFQSNTAHIAGGGVFWQVGVLRMEDANASFNRAQLGGGATLNMFSTGTLIRAVFEENQADESGGGLFLAGASRLIATNLSLLGNHTPDADASNRGGGISLNQGSRASLHATEYGASRIRGNASRFGGGIHADESWVRLSGNIRVEGNIAGHSGGALALRAGTGSVHQVYIQGNEANLAGAGIFAVEHSFLSMENTLLAEGRLADPMGGGGLDITDSTAFLDLCTIVHNDDYGIYQSNSDITVSDSLIYHNVGQSVAPGVVIQYSNIEGGHAGVGNFNAPPLLYAGNHHLTAWSPCRGAGQMAGPGHFDVDGEARPDGARFDVGFDHFQDSDDDGLPDIVETGTGVMVSDLDVGTDPLNPDSSGNDMPDGDMWLAGLDPNDPDGRLELTGLTPEGDDIRVHWRGGVAAHQVVEFTTDLAAEEPVWQEMMRVAAPTPVENDILFEEGERASHFRIRASRFGF